MKQRTLLICAMALVALTAVAAMTPMTATHPPSPQTTISILELHRQTDVKSLPELKIENFDP